MWGGLIAGALTGGAQAATQIADDQIKLNDREKMLRLQQEMEDQRMVRAEQLARERLMWQVDPAKGGYADLSRQNRVEDEKVIGAARSGVAVQQARDMIPVDVERERTLAPVRQENAVSQAEAVKKAENRIEREDTLAKGGDKNYLNAVAALSDAKESSAVRASAAKTIYDMKRQQYVDQVRDTAAGLMAAGDKAGAEEQLRVADMMSGKAQAKNFTDVAAFAKVLEGQAAALLDPMKGGNPDDPKNIAEATAIRQRIQEMAADVSNRRGVGGGGSAAPAAPSIPAPQTKAEFDKLPRGTRYTAPDGSIRIKQ